MKTIEEKLRAAFELGRIAGAAETIDDEATRDLIYGSAAALFDGLLTEAGEDERAREEGTRELRDAYSKVVVDCAMGAFPPDPFDFVATGEMVESPEPKPTRQTNFTRLTKSPGTLARNLAENVYECPRGECPYDDRHDPSKEDCVRCLTDWLNEEAEDK